MCLSDGLGRRLIRQDTGYVNSSFEELCTKVSREDEEEFTI